jgi:hypothetical protein
MIHRSATLAHSEIVLRRASSPNKTSSISSQPVSSQNTRAFSQVLSKLTVQTASQTIAAGQVSVAAPGHREVATGFAALVPTTAPVMIPPATSSASAIAAAPAPAVTGNSKSDVVKHWYGADAVDDAYWAKQPAAVQQLREIQDPDQRLELGTQLAHKGYSIDVPIMVWGWDAGKVTAMRESFGYTWVSSALQKPVQAAPGLTGPGITPYDPTHPPTGSILV